MATVKREIANVESNPDLKLNPELYKSTGNLRKICQTTY